jgi:pSer/pThr/pTyr-binding forkhead associated (FHA) protein/tetratricopeptide (TPR) repeat protein
MRKRPQQDEGEPFDEEPGEQAQAPLPDRTRIEASPFAERPAPGPERTRIEPAPVAPEPARKPRTSRPGTPSVVVEEKASEAQRGRRAPRAAEPATPSIEDWEAPAGEFAEATQIAAPPTSRPPRRHSLRNVERAPEPEEAEGWEPPPKVDDANATRLAMVPPERERGEGSGAADENATQAGPPISIQVVQGPDEGMRLPVRGGRMIIGRGDGCDFKLKDAAASRRHCELVGSPSGVVVRDLGSGNGTRVNGERITEAVVSHGDRIALGQTVLLVVDDIKKFEEERQRKLAAAHPPRPAPPRRPLPPPVEEPEEDDDPTGGTAGFSLPHHGRSNGLMGRFRALPKPMRLTVLGGGGLLGLLLLFAVLGALKPAPPPPGPPPEESEYVELFEQGKELLRAQKHDEALERFKAAQQISDKPELARYIETCERDGKGVKILAEAKALAAAGEHVKAIALLKEIDSLASSFDEAKQLAEAYEKERIRTVHANIDKLLGKEDVEAARALLASLPEEEAAAARRRIDEGEREISASQADRARNARRRAENAKRDQLRKARQEVDSAISGVVRKIEVGNFDGAERELDRVLDSATSKHVVAKAKALRKQIPKFAVAYRDGISKYNGGAYESAADPLLRALTLWEDMDLEGDLGDKLQTKVGKSMEAKGRSALARQEYGIAARAYREALRFNPSSVEAKSGLQEIARRAKEVYLEGYVEKDRNPDFARRKFREVLDMVPSDNQVHQDARRRLEDLESK